MQINESKAEQVFNFSEKIIDKFLNSGLLLEVPNIDMLSSYYLDKKGNAIEIVIHSPHKLSKQKHQYCYLYVRNKKSIDKNYPYDNFGNDEDLIELYDYSFDSIDVFDEIEESVDYAISYILKKHSPSTKIVDKPSKIDFNLTIKESKPKHEGIYTLKYDVISCVGKKN